MVVDEAYNNGMLRTHSIYTCAITCHNLCVFSVKHFNRTKCICMVVYLAFVKVFLVFVKVYLRAKIAGELFLLGGQGSYPADVS